MTTLWLVMASTVPAELHSASFGNLINTASLKITPYSALWSSAVLTVPVYVFPQMVTCHITVTADPRGNLPPHCCGPLPRDLWGKQHRCVAFSSVIRPGHDIFHIRTQCPSRELKSTCLGHGY